MKCKKKVAFFSLEMSREQLAARLLSTEGLIPGTKLRTGKLSNEEWQRLIEAADVLSKAELYIDYSSNITVPEIKAKLKKQKGFDLVIIDYLQLLAVPAKKPRSESYEKVMRDLKKIAKDNNCIIFMTSQLSRALESRCDKRPLLSDLRESGAIENISDVVMFIYRRDYYTNPDYDEEDYARVKGEAEIIVAKNKYGTTATIRLLFRSSIMKFLEPPQAEFDAF